MHMLICLSFRCWCCLTPNPSVQGTRRKRRSPDLGRSASNPAHSAPHGIAHRTAAPSICQSNTGPPVAGGVCSVCTASSSRLRMLCSMHALRGEGAQFRLWPHRVLGWDPFAANAVFQRCSFFVILAGAQHIIHGIQYRIHTLAVNLVPSGVNLSAVRGFVVASSRRVLPRCQVAGHATEGFRLYLVPLKVAQMHFGLLVYPAGFASRSSFAAKSR